MKSRPNVGERVICPNPLHGVHEDSRIGPDSVGTVIAWSSSPQSDNSVYVDWGGGKYLRMDLHEIERQGETLAHGGMLDLGKPTHDRVNHPSHYVSDPSGVECIQITRHRNFNIGNAIKYLWRNGLKSSSADPLAKQIEDLEKARWYIADEIERLKSGAQ